MRESEIAKLTDQMLAVNDVGGEEIVDTGETEDVVLRYKDDFIEHGVVLTSAMDIGNEFQDVVDILDAKLRDGTSFTAEYLPYQSVIRNIDIPGYGIAIKGEIGLNNLIVAIESERAGSKQRGENLADVKEYMQDAWSITETDPLAQVRPEMIDLSKRIVFNELQEIDISVSLGNIVMISPDRVRVEQASFGELQGRSVEFVYHLSTKTIESAILLPDNVQLTSRTIDELVIDAESAVELAKTYNEYKKRVNWALETASAILTDAVIEITPDGVGMNNVIYKNWVLSGLADGENEIFLMINNEDGLLLRDIPYANLTRRLAEVYQSETTDEL
jgi:hypothetical protein